MKITIITPVYNNEETIERTIKSVISQKASADVEYIIVDGKSKDNTLSIIEKYKNQIDRVISEKDKGISDAYNKGIKLATGDLIGIVAADDWLVPGVLQLVAREYDGTSDVFVGNNIANVGTSRYRLTSNSTDLDELKFRMSLCHPSMLVTKSAYEKYGLYYLDYRCAMDRELSLRYYLAGAKFQFSNLYVNVFTSYGGISTSEVSIPDQEDDLISEKYGIPHGEVELYRLEQNKQRKSLKKKIIKTITGIVPEFIKDARAKNNKNYVRIEDIMTMYQQ